MSSKKSGIYKITNKINHKFYIGSTKDLFRKRWYNHKSELRNNKHKNLYLQNSWNKYGENNFEFSILESDIKYENLIEREQFWIDITRCTNRDIGYNICKDASCPNPREFTPEQLAEQCERMAPGGYTITTPTGESIQVDNLSEYARQHNLQQSTLTACARGRISSHKGYYVKRTLPEYQVEYVSAYDKRPDKYVLFDPKGKRYQTNNLTQFCKDHNIESQRTALVNCAKGKNYHSNNWQCHYVDKAPKEYIPTEQLANRLKYWILDEENNEYYTQNISKFCELHNLNENIMRKCSLPDYPNKSYKNWKCYLDNEDLNKKEIIANNGFITKKKPDRYKVILFDGTILKSPRLKDINTQLNLPINKLSNIFRGKVEGSGFGVKEVIKL